MTLGQRDFEPSFGLLAVVKAGQGFAGDPSANAPLNSTKACFVLGGDQSVGVSDGLRPGRAANPVDVVIRGTRDVEIYH
jgi:hypothetical protein